MTKESVLTTGDIAKICNVSQKTAAKWFDKGIISGYRLPGSKDRRIPIDELYRFMREANIPIPQHLQQKCGSL